MRRDPYRHSVWIDVLGVVLVGAILLGGAGYLVYSMGNSASRGSAESSLRGGSSPSMRGSRSGQTSRSTSGRRAQSGTARPLLSSRSESASSGGTAPFSEEWRAEAAPSLAGPSATSGAGLGEGGGAGLNRSGAGNSPSRSSRSFGDGAGSGDADRSARSDWRAEAQRLGGQARALSSQLGQMSQRDGRDATEQSSPQKESGGPRSASASRTNQNVPEPPPPSVPIDDHLHWLLVAGVLWGAWRIWSGG